ncbi:hypothetical protein A71_267 [Escherichia phage A7_1]|nr:hypothetical protein A71_267 [Escherichia phage A7_1]
MVYRTFEEWKKKGRVVVKGEEATGFLKDGTALFSKEQTKKTPTKSYTYGQGYDSWYMGDEYEYY